MNADAPVLAKALAWLNEQLAENPQANKLRLVETAATRFDLGPLDEEWLLRQITEHPAK